MKFKPANNIQDLQYFGEFGGVNPSISDSSTYTFLSAKTMFDTFEGNADGCYLYSRHSTPSNLYLGEALAAMEGTETANVTASGMGAITPVLMQLCGSGDHIVSSRTIYGGTYAYLKNFMPRFNVSTSFVDITKLDAVEAAITKNTKVLYCESVSNPLLEVADIKALAELAKKHDLKLIVDNTFSPLSISTTSFKVETGAIFSPGTKDASFWFSGGTIIPLIPCFLALMQIGRIPFTGRSSPSRLSSPMSIILSRKLVSTWRNPHRIATAMGRSNAAPSLRISAGAKFTVMRLDGILKPEFFMAASTRSLLSLTAPSGKPTVKNAAGVVFSK